MSLALAEGRGAGALTPAPACPGAPCPVPVSPALPSAPCPGLSKPGHTDTPGILQPAPLFPSFPAVYPSRHGSHDSPPGPDSPVPAGGRSPAHLVPVHQLEAQDVLQLPQADGTQVQRPPQGLVQAERPLHEAAQPAAAPQTQQVAQLMARDLREKATAVLAALTPATQCSPSRTLDALGKARWPRSLSPADHSSGLRGCR